VQKKSGWAQYIAKVTASGLLYIRDKEGREVDFAIVKEGEVEALIEVNTRTIQ